MGKRSEVNKAAHTLGRSIGVTMGIVSMVVTLVFFIFKFILFAGANTFNLGTLFNHGGGFYINNIITAHQSSYILTSKSFVLYNKIPLLKDLDNTNYIIQIIPEKKLLKHTGYINKTGSAWLAVEFYKDDKRQKGYLHIPSKINYDPLRINSIKGQFLGEDTDKKIIDEYIQKIKYKQFKQYEGIVAENNWNLVHINNAAELQEFEESPEYKKYQNVSKYNIWKTHSLFIQKNQANKLIKAYKSSTSENDFIRL